MQYSGLTIDQQLTTVRTQIQAFESEHYDLSLRDLINDGPSPVGTDNGKVVTTEERRKRLETAIELLGKEEERLEALLPKKQPPETNTGIIAELNAPNQGVLDREENATP